MPVPGADLRIEPMADVHADEVLAIYQAGIEEGNATFETIAPDWAAFTATRLPAHRYVATTGGQVAGWVAASAVSGRCVYGGVVEHAVYVRPGARGRGIGRLILDAMITSTEAAGIWTIQSGIFPENTPSLALHRAAGFRVVGTRERIGQHHGRWRDIVLIERRRPAVLTAPGQDRPQQPTQRRVDRSGRHVQPPACVLPQRLDYRVSVPRADFQCGQQQRVQVPFSSPALICSSATLTMPSRQYARYRNSYT
jgi:L-amino acid N-acyltransferase YncA